jgi:RHS repeat-associated protein
METSIVIRTKKSQLINTMTERFSHSEKCASQRRIAKEPIKALIGLEDFIENGNRYNLRGTTPVVEAIYHPECDRMVSSKGRKWSVTERFLFFKRKRSAKKALRSEGIATYWIATHRSMRKPNYSSSHTTYLHNEGNATNWIASSIPASTTWRYEFNVTDHLGNVRAVISDLNNNKILNISTSATTTPSFRIEYTISDHLGNARITFTDKNNNGKVDVDITTNNEILQENHYYAFGLGHNSPWLMTEPSKDNLYQYNGKEYNADHNLKWSDYGARFYDATIGRWSVPDPMAIAASNWSTYRYGFNNPIRYNDPTGMLENSFIINYEPYNGTEGGYSLISTGGGKGKSKEKGTRVYDIKGRFKYKIKDSFPVEDHFFDNNGLINLNSMYFNNANDEGTYARKNSKFYIGQNTKNQILNILKTSKSENLERAFALYLTSDSRELQVKDLTTSKVKRGARSFDLASVILDAPTNTVATGHTHLFNNFPTQIDENEKAFYDYSAFGMRNMYTGKVGGYPFIIAHVSRTISVYTTVEKISEIYNPNVGYYYNYKYILPNNYEPPLIKL